MKAAKPWAAACLAAAIGAAPALAAETATPARTTLTTQPVAIAPAPAPVKTVDAARLRLSGVQTVIETLDAQIATPPPKGLTAAQLLEWKEHGAWLSSVRERYANFLAENGGAFGDSAGLAGTAGADLTKKMAQMNMQFLSLQEATQMESRKFQTLSNASKARHEIAMNAIRNLK